MTENEMAEEDAVITIRVRVSHHPNDLNTTQIMTETHLRTGPKSNPFLVRDAIQKAIGHENREFCKYHGRTAS